MTYQDKKMQILSNLLEAYSDSLSDDGAPDPTIVASRALDELVREYVIGSDEPPADTDWDISRNVIRAEQRQVIDKGEK